MNYRFKLASKKVLRYKKRDVLVVQTSQGNQAFYKRTGKAGVKPNGPQPGDWVPFYGIAPGWFVKPPKGGIYRYGNQENVAAGKWLSRQGIPKGKNVSWQEINEFFYNTSIIGKCYCYGEVIVYKGFESFQEIEDLVK